MIGRPNSNHCAPNIFPSISSREAYSNLATPPPLSDSGERGTRGAVRKFDEEGRGSDRRAWKHRGPPPSGQLPYINLQVSYFTEMYSV